MENLTLDDLRRTFLQRALDDLFLVMQLTCYPGDYVAESPTPERMAETMDKLEEDLLGIPFAKPRARRAAILTFGPLIPVARSENRKQAIADLTHTLETSVQQLLDSILLPARV
jgi:hypothetical protein